MGDRANVVIIDSDTDLASKTAVFLYTHWAGTELPEIVRDALQSDAGIARSDDPPYLARIIFDRMIGSHQGAETGFGISTQITDNEYPLLVVDTRRQIVVEYPEAVYKDSGFSKLDDYSGEAFAAYQGEWKEKATV